jgi:maltose alpha-D-glucosyltransferase/alpha-amylase
MQKSTPSNPDHVHAPYPTWLSRAVIYQIYPQSFQDSNGDGIGDLPGITRRLDYLASLGVNTLWLNPIFDSPFLDAGYDIRNFYKVAPRYGTETDLKELFAQAHRREMRVLLDLVPGHTSMDHAWFQAEAANPKNPKSHRYVWKNRDFDPSVGPSKDDYIPSFFWHQPALNYGWEQVTEPWMDPVDADGPTQNRAELRKILAYWLDRGADGFRVDMAATLVKHDPRAQGVGCEGNSALWRELRAWWDQHYPDRLLVAEWSAPDRAIPAGFHLDFLMHFNAPGYPSLFFNGVGSIPAKEGPCYFDAEGRGSLDIFKESYARQLAGTRGKGYLSLPSANHDFQRLRCGERGWEGLRPAWVFLLTQAGPPTLYYGDEIGMRFLAGSPPKEGSTLEGITADNAGAADGERSGTRTPMQWDDTANAGFSTAPAGALYLPLDSDTERPTVAAQATDPTSLLNFVRTLLRLRAKHPALGAEASYEILNPSGTSYPLVVLREAKGERIMIVVNPSRSARKFPMDKRQVIGPSLLCEGVRCEADDGKLHADPFGHAIFTLPAKVARHDPYLQGSGQNSCIHCEKVPLAGI